MIRACLGMLAGVYALQLSSFAAGSDLVGVAIVSIFFVLIIRPGSVPSWFFIGITVFVIAAAGVIDSRLDPLYAGDSMVVDVRIASFPVNKGETVTMIAEPIEDDRISPRIRLSWFQPIKAPRFGDVWQFEIRLRRPRGNANPGVFDYEAWLFRERIGATGYVASGRRNQLLRSGELSLVDQVRQRFVERLQALPVAPDAAAVLAAISVGARHLVTPEQWERFARTGTSHLMAISGLHIGLAAGGGYMLACLISGVLLRQGNHHLRAAACALTIACLYALVSGLALPAQRATLMMGLLAMSILRRRAAQPMLILCAACFTVVLSSPVTTLTPGFKLSFAAVLALIWLARRRNTDQVHGLTWRAMTFARDLGTVQVMLLLGLLPLTVLIFDRVSLVAPIVNFMVVPVFSLVTVPFALLGMSFDGPLQIVGDALLMVAAGSLDLAGSLIEIAAQLPGAAHRIPALRGVAWLVLFLPALWVLLPPGWPGRPVAWFGIAALLVYEPPQPDAGCTEIDVLDVGQGLAVVARTARQVVLYDVGPAFRGGSSMAQTVVMPALESRGVERIDALVISHADSDHAGGVGILLREFDVRRTLAGELLPDVSVAQQLCRDGQHWQADGVVFRILHPASDTWPQGNDASCVLLIEAGKHRMLLTGDIEEQAERELLRNHEVPPITALTVPHHGSRTSSSLPFVQRLRPRLAIVSSGHGNRWGLPESDVLDRWRRAGAKVLNTANSGAITIRMCAATGIQTVARRRLEHRRIWHE